jgi:hypothetical protein
MNPTTEGSAPYFVLLFVVAAFFIFFTGRAGADSANPFSYRLIGTITSNDFIGAVINDPKGEQSFYRLYAKLPDGSQIVEVRNKSIQLKDESGTRYDVYINSDINMAGTPASPPPQNTRLEARPPAATAPASDVQAGQPNPRRGKPRRNSSVVVDE